MDILAGFIFVLLVVTLVGHGLWKLFATLGRAIIGTSKTARPKPPAWLMARAVDEIGITPEQFARLRDAGLVEPGVYQQVSMLRASHLPDATVARDEAPAINREIPTASIAEPLPLPAAPHDSHAATPPPIPQTAPARPAIPVRPPAPPAKPFTQVLASFMQQNNIRWGELIGGLLIIGCSAALVVSFWTEISQRPIFKFSLFTAVTAALFGLGLYSEHRWKLPTTSRGVLLIATLLVPLNCLALAAFSSRGAPALLALIAQVLSLVLFAGLLWQAAKVISPQWPVLLTAGTVALSASTLVLRIIEPTGPSALQTFALALAPVFPYLLFSALMLRTARRWKTFRAPAAEGIFLLLGTFTFAAILGLLLLISQASSPASNSSFASRAQTLRNICAPISAAGLPALTAGLLVWRRAKGIRSSAIRIAGGAIAILGGGALLLGLGLAWPQPSAILPVAAFDFAALLVIAFLYELPPVLFVSIPCLGLAWLVGFHVIAGHLPLHDSSGIAAQVLLEPSGGTALAPFTLVLAVIAFLLLRNRRTYATVIGTMAVISAVIGIMLLNADGFARHGDPYFATWIYLAYAVTLFIAARSIPIDWLVLPAWAILYAAFAHFFVSHSITHSPWGASLLGWATVAAAISALRRFVRRVVQSPNDSPEYWIALLASLIGALALSTTSRGRMSPDVPSALLWLSGIWLIVGVNFRQVLIATAAICFAITAAYIRTIRPAPLELSVDQLIRLLELNSAALSVMALLTSRFWRGFTIGESQKEPRAVQVQLSVATAFLVLVVLPATAYIAINPGSSFQAIAGDLWTWLAAAALTTAVFSRRTFKLYDLSIARCSLLLLAFAALLACSVDHFTMPAWHAYHALLAGCAASGWLIFGYGAWIGSRLLGVSVGPNPSPAVPGITLEYHQPAQTPVALASVRASLMFGRSRLEPAVIGWSLAVVVGTVLLCARAALDDPSAPWWAVSVLVAVASLLPMLASWAYRPGLLYPATVLLNLAAIIWFAHIGYSKFTGNVWANFALVNIVVVTLCGLAWLVLDVTVFSGAELPQSSGPHRSAAVGSVIGLAMVVAYGLAAKFVTIPFSPPDQLLVLASLLTIAALVFASLWERNVKHALAALYAVGLLVIAAAFAFSTADAKASAWGISLALAGYALGVGALWMLKAQLKAIARVIAIPVDAHPWSVGWLTPVNTGLVLITASLAYWADFAFADRLHRVAPSIAAMAGGFALVLLAWDNLKISIRQSALVVIAVASVSMAWAIMSPKHATILDRTVAVFVTFSVVSSVYLFVLPRVIATGSMWVSIATGEGLRIGIVAAAAVLFALGIEVSGYISHGRESIRGIDIALVLAALLGACAVLIVTAVRKKQLPGSIRSACVYGAEATLSLAFVHLRVTKPELFGGALAAYWPLILMAIAFAGVGAAEALRRRYDAVLVRPIEQSGIFLPVLPVLAFWAAPPRSVNFGQLLLAVAFFYGLVSALRRSFIFAIVGVLAANGALWYLLKQMPGWGFSEHPQVWLIPGALAVLIAAQFNRKRMDAEQLRAIRYACDWMGL